jgi:effector-binding domain-containing protein
MDTQPTQPLTQPTIIERGEQTYVGVRRTITMSTFPEIADRIPEVFGWLASRGIAPSGPPFFRFNLIDMDRELVVEAGVPVPAAVTTEKDVFCDVLPAGRYATVTHIGHPDELIEVTGALLRWASAQGHEWDMEDTGDGQRWGCRLEIYHTDPREEPDMSRWETQLAFRLAG